MKLQKKTMVSLGRFAQVLHRVRFGLFNVLLAMLALSSPVSAQQISKRYLDKREAEIEIGSIHSISSIGDISIDSEISETTGRSNVIAKVKFGNESGICIIEEILPQILSLAISEDIARSAFLDNGFSRYDLIKSAKNLRVYRASQGKTVLTHLFYYVLDENWISQTVIACDEAGNKLIKFNVFYIADDE